MLWRCDDVGYKIINIIDIEAFIIFIIMIFITVQV